ncbi:MAG: lysophospholipid acyltransferase family protein [Chloroflexi bacterium]|nr:lysophospholipid acyltransferase family protein [Chloroflexota bacterium]
MKLDFQFISNSRLGVGLTLWVGRTMPLALSYRIANFGANLIARRDNSITRAIRLNQWVVRGKRSSPEELDQALREVLCHAGRCFADFYHNMSNSEGLKALVPLSPMVEKLIQRSQAGAQGAFLVAPHLSAFDIALLGLAHHGLRGNVMSYGNPPGGYQIQNKIRASTGMKITPARGEETHREFVEWMRSGGMAITAIDRPIRSKAHTLTFFGHPSPLPAGHIRMALEADVPVIVSAAQMSPEGKYNVLLSDPIPMEHHPVMETAIQRNAEAVLAVIEGFIRQAPGQWMMYYPVWPDMTMDDRL